MSKEMKQVLPESERNKIKAAAFAADPRVYHNDISQFASAYNLTYGQAMEFMIEPDDESVGTVVEDFLERCGYVLETTRDNESTPTHEVFDTENVDTAEANAVIQWAKDEYFSSIHTDDFYLVGTQPVQFAASTRGGLTDAINRPNYGNLQTTYLETDDIQLSDIIARRIPVRGNTYVGPKIDRPDDFKLTNIGEGANIPKWYMSTGKDVTTLVKAGYGTSVTYELLRANNVMNLEALGEFSRMMGFLTLQEMINEGIQVIALAATGYPDSGNLTLDKKEFIKMVGQRKSGTSYNTIIGTLEFMADYLGIDLTYTSSNQTPGMGARTLIEQLVGTQRLGIRTSEEVNALSATKSGVLFDRRYMLEYLFERGGDINEQKRNAENQTIDYFNTFQYAYRLTSFASDAGAILATLT